MFRSLIRNREGSVFVIVALSVMAVVGSVGVAVDIGRSQMVQAKLQNAVDAAGLAAGATLSTADLKDVATKYINLNFKQGNLGATLNSVDAVLSQDKKILTVTATAELPTTVMKIFGNSKVTVDASTEVTRSNKGLEVALVLDTTGSMAGSKLTALKSASHDLLDILFGSEATAQNLWVGVVPFAASVNIGPSRTNWLIADEYNALPWYTSSWAGCVDARVTSGKDVTDDPPYDLLHPNDPIPAAPFERLMPYYWYDNHSNLDNTFNNWIKPTSTDTSVCSSSSSCTCTNYGPCSTPVTATTVSGNVTTTTVTTITCTGSGSSKSCNKNVGKTTYTIDGSRGPNLQCPSPITPLTNKKAKVETGIDALVAQGNTHINFGAVWGWRLISPRWRGYWGGDMETNGLPLNYNAPLMSKAVIIMTDGANTLNTSANGAYGYVTDNVLGTTDPTAAAAILNSKTTTVCNALKAQGVIVYTILFQENNNTIKTLLKNCATNPDYFFDSPSESSLQSAFQTIGDSLANLRISK